MHRLNDLGAVCTHAAHGISHEGFDAEWRGIDLFTFEGDLVNRCEVFDETDLEAALARFDELHPQTRRLENAASQIAGRNQEHFTARNWDAMTEMLTDDFSSDDRRRVVNAGIRRGRDAAIQDAHANSDLGAKAITSTVIATRGERLVLLRAQYSSSPQRPEAFHVDVLNIYEIDADERIAAVVTFDPDDFDAAIAEFDARYLAGEAAAHARVWSVIAQGYAAFNRQELPAAGLGYGRPPARYTVRAFQHERFHPRHLGPHARPQHPHRGGASAERYRGGHHPRRTRNLARGLRRRMARDRPRDSRRRNNQWH